MSYNIQGLKVFTYGIFQGPRVAQSSKKPKQLF